MAFVTITASRLGFWFVIRMWGGSVFFCILASQACVFSTATMPSYTMLSANFNILRAVLELLATGESVHYVLGGLPMMLHTHAQLIASSLLCLDL